jgi:hypothetical protein
LRYTRPYFGYFVPGMQFICSRLPVGIARVYASAMLVIRNAQMDAFREASTQSQLDEIIRHLSSKYPDHSRAIGGESALRDFVQRGLRTASTYGVDSPESTAALLELLIQFGEDFAHSPVREWSLTMLRHPVLAGDLKVDAVWTRHQQLTQGRTFVRL